ncbi:MAG TPA: tetratricopeptide repeat protein [Ktedonobacterales bacterium]
MGTFTCPNCHQPVAPADEICDSCGMVLTPTAGVPQRSSVTVQPGSAPASTGSSNLNACPHCHQPLALGDEICDQCGAVLSKSTGLPQPTSASAPTEECPSCHAPRRPGVKFCNHCGVHFPAEPEPAGPLTIGLVLNNRYKVIKAIGSGGMGAVYLAEDQMLKRQVVMKVLLSTGDAEMIAQSIKEREFLAAIKHANIVSIYDFLTVGTHGYIVMEYVNGKTLDQIMEEQGHPFAVEDAIRYMIGILPAFTYLAKLGLVYCDFKPQNVMLEVLKDGTQVLKLIDLGTVIKVGPKPDAVYGTPGFFAREAIKTPSPETDLYTICRTLAYLVTQMDPGNPPFGVPPSEHYKAFRDSPTLYRLLEKGTHAEAMRRFHSAEDLADQLAGVLRQIVGGTPGVSVTSRLFISGMLTTSGKLGLRGEAALDEQDSAIRLLRAGDQALRSGNYASAQNFFTQATSANPRSLDGHLRLAEILIDEGKFSEALAEITRVQRLAPAHWKIAWYTGRLLEAQGNLAAAAEQYRHLMADLPGELPPQQALARVSAQQGKGEEAVKLYTTVLKADPGNTDAIFGVTQALFQLKQWDEAIKILEGVSQAAARYVDAQLMLCGLYLEKINPLTAHRAEQAALIVNALEGRTEDPRFFLTRGNVYRMLWRLARQKQLPSGMTISGGVDTRPQTLGAIAEASYKEYLRREAHPANREAILSRKFEVAPWRLW